MLDTCITAALEFYEGIVPARPGADVAEGQGRRLHPVALPRQTRHRCQGRAAFDSDSNNHRIVVTDLDGKFIETIGTGRIGLVDGAYDKARFSGCRDSRYTGTTFTWPTRKTTLRVVDTKTKTVTTLVGNGTQGRDYNGGRGGREQISTPWDVYVEGGQVFIAMAGTHQIWTYNLEENRHNFSGNAPSRTSATPIHFRPPGRNSLDSLLARANCSSRTARQHRPAISLDRSDPHHRRRRGCSLGTCSRSATLASAKRPDATRPRCTVVGEGKGIVADTYNHRLKLLDPKANEVVLDRLRQAG